MQKNFLKSKQIISLVKLALKEDIGKGDITTNFLIPENLKTKAFIFAKEPGIICGLKVAKLVFQILDPKISFKELVKEGEKVKKGQKIAILEGKARKILIGERTALNFLQHLSGIATLTRRYVDIVKPFKVKIFDTRKTTPGQRLLEKYAVRVGRGKSYRLGLWDKILIKSNHVRLIGMEKCVEKSKNLKREIEIEARSLNEIKEILKAKPKIIMLDNMSLKQIKKAIKLIGKKAIVEVSGQINLKNIKKIAKLGVDRISLGKITHSANALDLALRIEKN